MEDRYKYNLLDDLCFSNYLKQLINSIYKILPIKEKEPITLIPYLESLRIELIGNYELKEKIKCDANFLRLIGTIQYLITHDCAHKEIKTQVFKCISIVEKLQNIYGMKDG